MKEGFAPLILILFVPIIIGGFFLISSSNNPFTKMLSPIETYERVKEDLSVVKQELGRNVSWQFNKTWQAIGTPPACPESLVFPSPVDVSLASGILYPGQIRGTDYKPHGGFRFDTQPSNNINVYSPMDASLYKAAQHMDNKEVQYSLFFINDCGIMYKLDHLRELTNKFNEIIEKIPMGEEGDSRTTDIIPQVFVAKGEHIATKVGYEHFSSGSGGKNIFFDFGVYDLRKTNGVTYDSSFREKHPNINEYGAYALCWFDYLEEKDRVVVKNLPAGGSEGKVSDYCK